MTAPAPSLPTRWPLWKRVGFRFACLYCLLTMTSGLFLPWRPVSEWFAGTVLHRPLPPSVAQNGSGDTLEAYVLAALYLLAALALTLVWSLLERRGHLTERLFWPAHTGLRLYTGFFLLFYGWSKILLSQMPAPDLTDLLTPLGEMSPMGLLWRSVGASPLYEVVGGLAEAVAGALLLTRRTSLPGALLGAGIMGYVFLLNLSYDVPVKLFSGHLLLFCLLLLAPFLPRLWAVVLNRPAAPVRFPSPHAHPVRHRLALLGAVLVALAALVLPPVQVSAMERQYESRPAPSTLSGVYRVLDDSRPAAPRLDDDDRWQVVAFGDRSYPGSPPRMLFRARLVSGREVRGTYDVGAQSSILTVLSGGGPMLLHHRRPDAEHLLLTGKENGTPFRVELILDPDATRLTSRGFRWVNEEPYSR